MSNAQFDQARFNIILERLPRCVYMHVADVRWLVDQLLLTRAELLDVKAELAKLQAPITEGIQYEKPTQENLPHLQPRS